MFILVCACVCVCVHLLLLLDLASQLADLLRPFGGLSLQQPQLLLQVWERVGSQVQREAEVPHLTAQLLLLLSETAYLTLALLEEGTHHGTPVYKGIHMHIYILSTH